ncbi:MAG: PPC domain-containing protein [Aureliella sp.]
MLSQSVVRLTVTLVFGMLASVAVAQPSLTHLKPAGMQRGTTQTIECFGKFDWPINVQCLGATVECLEKSGQLSVTVAPELSSDCVWLRLYDSSGASASVPLLVSDAASLAEVEPNNVPDEAQVIPSVDGSTSVIVDGVLEKRGEVDGFAVQLAAGQTLVAVVDANASFGSPMDSIIQVVSPSGTVVGENHDFRGLDPGVTFTAKEAGIYVVRLFAWPSKPNQQIAYQGAANFIYRLTLTTEGYITHPVEQIAEPGSSVRVAGFNLPPALKGIAVPLSTGPQGTQRDANGKALGFVRIPGIVGSARVQIAVDTGDDGPAIEIDNSSGSEMAVGDVRSGLIEQAGDDHMYSLTLRKDQTVDLLAESVSLYSDLVPILKLSDSKGKVLKQTSERGAAVDAKLTFKAAADGDYQLSVRDRFNSAGPRHFYRLSVTERRSDFKLSIATDRFTVTKDKPLEIPLAISRTSGVGEPVGDIAFVVEGLPGGVTAAPAISKAGGESAKKVTLKLSASGQAFSGPIRIVGTSASGLERAAMTPPSYGVAFDRAWLTAKPSE